MDGLKEKNFSTYCGHVEDDMKIGVAVPCSRVCGVCKDCARQLFQNDPGTRWTRLCVTNNKAGQ